VDENEFAQRAYALPDRLADRLDSKNLKWIREYAEVGEWGEELDLLLACLQQDNQPITAEERYEIKALLDAMGNQHEMKERLDQLTVTE
jgi:hypothetical protein